MKAGTRMYVIDTYALIEWFIRHNPAYSAAFKRIDMEGGLICPTVLLEFYHKIFHTDGQQKADGFLDAVLAGTQIVELSIGRIKAAGKKRSEMLRQKKKLSYADCLNLVVAEEFKAAVLTGDKEFRGLPATEFIE